MMSLPSQTQNPLGIASALSPALFALGDPDLLVEVMDSSPTGVVLVEADARLSIVYGNETFATWAPFGGEFMVGRSVLDLFPRHDRPAIRAAYAELLRTRLPVHRRAGAPRWRSRPDGEDRWNVSHYPVRGPAGRLTHVLSLFVEVADESVSRGRMRDAQQRLVSAQGAIAQHLATSGDLPAFFGELTATIAELASAARVAFWVLDPETETLSVQPQAFGFTEDELAELSELECSAHGSRPVERVVFGDLVLRERLDGAGAARGAQRAQLEALGVLDTITIPWRVGEHRLGALVVYGSRRPSGFVDEDVWVMQAAATSAALVWEHRQADEAMAELREREAQRLRQQIEQSIQLEQLKADFLKLASHELRGPLSVVRGYISMMEDGTLGAVGENVAPVLPIMRAKLDEMNQLVNEMLETARLEDSALDLKMTRLDLRELIRESVRALEPLAGNRHQLVVSTPGTPVLVDGDRSRLTMILTNLVHNAIKYSPSGGEVRVACGARDGQAFVSVSDQGVGIAAEDLGRLFTRFGRIVTESTGSIPGTGLGLYLARDLARRHGGDVEVESEPGRGSTFTLDLPLVAPPGSPRSR
jgi:signal transduction histidine kinase